MIESAVRMGSGHVVIQAPGFQKRAGLDLTLDPEQVEAALKWSRQERFEITSRVKRIFASGLASSADGATGVRIIGIEPSIESEASSFRDKVVSGDYLGDDDRNRVLIGRGVARKLDLKVGDKLVLMVQAAGTSEIQSRLVRVKGILFTGLDEFDQILLIARLVDCQSFLGLPDRVHQVALLVGDVDDAKSVAVQARASLSSAEVLSWDQAMPELAEFIKIDDGGNYVFHIMLFLLIGFMVLNTLLMSVLERRREFSLLDAMGLPAVGRFGMVLVEAFFIAALSVLVGLALGYSCHFYFHVYGLPLGLLYAGDLSAAGVAFDPVIYSHLSLGRLLEALGLVFGLTLALALFPAARAARKGNVHALGT